MNTESPPSALILASTSQYRKSLLQKLALPFSCESPFIDEHAHSGESPAELVVRLAAEKAHCVAQKHPHAIVIGSDQVAVFEQNVVGKPGDHVAAAKQLAAFSGGEVEFLTCVSVQCLDTHFSEQYTDSTRVVFRTLEVAEIERYLLEEKPYDCAGAFKAESLGIVLFDSILSEDPSALIGLPLIKTAELLRRLGFRLP